jgi:hypothetical protein
MVESKLSRHIQDVQYNNGKYLSNEMPLRAHMSPWPSDANNDMNSRGSVYKQRSSHVYCKICADVAVRIRLNPY